MLNEEQLAAAEEMASHGFSVNEIAEVISPDDLMLVVCLSDDHESAFYKRYRKGYLSSLLELRQRIFKDAKHGSSPAQALAKKILDDAEYKLNNL